MDKMSREETLQAMKDIRSQYGDDVVIEFSGDGMAALVESKKSGHGVDFDQIMSKTPEQQIVPDDMATQLEGTYRIVSENDEVATHVSWHDILREKAPAEKAISAYDAKKEKVEDIAAVRVKTRSTARKTAADELSYLSKKYNNYSIVSANYSKGMKYGSKSTTNVAISPQFLAKMASDPELEKEYEGYLADMRELDAQEDRLQAAKGWHVAARGWAIDKDGGISKWGIVEKDNKKSHLQTMAENAEKIRKQNEEKKQEKVKMEERRKADREEREKLQEELDEAGKEQFGDKWKGAWKT